MKKKEKSVENKKKRTDKTTREDKQNKNKKKTQRMELRHPRLQKADKGSESHA